jgi:hypothetical protein
VELKLDEQKLREAIVIGFFRFEKATAFIVFDDGVVLTYQNEFSRVNMETHLRLPFGRANHVDYAPD